MGLLFSRFRKTVTTKEKLEEIEENIENLQSTLTRNRQQQKNAVLFLVLTSLIIYLIAVGIIYLFYLPTKWSDRLLYFVPFLLFPVLVFGLKRSLHFIFVTRISRNSRQLEELKKEKQRILESVIETETYKVAKEILEKFDPNRKLVEKADPTKTKDPESSQDIRRRNVLVNANNASQPIGPHPGFNRAPAPIQQSHSQRMPNMRSPQLMQNNRQRFNSPDIGVRTLFRPPLTPAASTFPRDRSIFDKVAEYFIGDGPSNRYALICKQCFSHNGMALAEEFPFTAYKCCYCGTFNPARQQRPRAPKLINETPVSHQQSAENDPSEKEENDEDKESQDETTEQDNEEDKMESDASIMKSEDIPN